MRDAPRRSPTTADRPDAATRPASWAAGDRRPHLLFFVRRTSGPCRRMHGLIAWLQVTRKASLRITEVDLDDNPGLARELGVETAPTLILLRDGHPLARLIGRATGKQIDDMLRPFVTV